MLLFFLKIVSGSFFSWYSTMTPLLYLLIAIVLVAIVVFGVPKERFQPEFLDKRQVKTTVAMEDSSFVQRTNHVQQAPYSMGPLQGMETPFQVNQYKAYIS
jgi:hypothetical protein